MTDVNKPVLRFEGFEEDWVTSKLKNIIKWSKGNKLAKSVLNSSKVGEKVIHYADLYKFGPVITDVIHWSESGQGTAIPNNSILFPMSDVTPTGLARTSAIDKSNIKAGGDTLIGTLSPDHSSYFLSYQINTNSQKIIPLVTGTTVKHINSKSLDTIDVSLTNINEQIKISNFFQIIEHIIYQKEKQITLLKKQKSGFLQQLFPKESEDEPELRIKDFSGSWKQIKLGKILFERKEKAKITKETPLLAFASGQGVIDRSERKTNNRDFLTKDSMSKVYLLTKFNDIVYNPSNLKYGAIDRNKHGQGVISPIYVTFETNQIPEFMELIVTSQNFKQKALQYEEGTVIKRQSVKPENLLTLDISIPKSLEEQTKIGNFFKQLDDTITLQEQQLEKLKEMKKGYLQQMFI